MFGLALKLVPEMREELWGGGQGRGQGRGRGRGWVGGDAPSEILAACLAGCVAKALGGFGAGGRERGILCNVPYDTIELLFGYQIWYYPSLIFIFCVFDSL